MSKNQRRTKQPEPEPESDSDSGSYSYYSYSYDSDSEDAESVHGSSHGSSHNSSQSTSSEPAARSNKKEKQKLSSASDILTKIMDNDVEEEKPQSKKDEEKPQRKKQTQPLQQSQLHVVSSAPIPTPKVSKQRVSKVVEDDDNGIYFVGFCYQTGLRKEELPIKVWFSNNIGADRKSWEAGVPNGLKLHTALHCKTGDADKVHAAWDRLHASKAVPKSKMWYLIKKADVDSFVKSIVTNLDYEVVTEGKAKRK